MPTSRDGNLYFTDKQKELALSRNNALDYARSQGYDLIPKGKDFTLRDHDSMVFKQDGSWFWNSHNLRGKAIQFIMYYEEGLADYEAGAYKKAIIKLAGENAQTNTPRPEKAAAQEPPSEQKPFVPPEPNNDHKRAFAYLTKTRGIDPDIVSQLMKEKKIYESKDRHNAVFAFQNNDGETKGAFLRGTSTDPQYQFKGMATGSDRADSYFSFGGSKTANVACVFEASIDALSYATLQKLSGNFDITQRYYVATGGAGDGNFLSFLKGHPEVKSVILCQDNDAAGNKFAKDLGDKLRGMGYQVSRCLSKGKDFNDELKKEKALDKPSQQNPHPAANEAQTENKRFVVFPNSNGYGIHDTVSGRLINGDYGNPAHYLDRTEALDLADKLNNSSGYIDSRQIEYGGMGSITLVYRAVYMGNSQNDIYGDWRKGKEEANDDLRNLQQQHAANEPQTLQDEYIVSIYNPEGNNYVRVEGLKSFHEAETFFTLLEDEGFDPASLTCKHATDGRDISGTEFYAGDEENLTGKITVTDANRPIILNEARANADLMQRMEVLKQQYKTIEEPVHISSQTIEAVKSEVEAARIAANPNHVSMQEFGAAIEAWADEYMAAMEP